MGNKYCRTTPINLPVQLMHLKQTYGDLITMNALKNSVLSCTIRLTPSIESEPYTVLITYKLSNYSPKAWLMTPKIERYNNKLPEHIYGFDSSGHPRLCVYYPGANEWTPQMLIASSYVPWIVTWLNTYEYWQITGEWYYPAVSHKKKNVR